MDLTTEQLFKPGKTEGDRKRLDFENIQKHRPDIGNRVFIIRSRVKDLRKKLGGDSNTVMIIFNCVTITVVFVTLVGTFMGASSSSPPANVAIGGVVAILGAALTAFGLHKRYHALFKAYWAMASLEVQIDDLICNIVLDVEGGQPLSKVQSDFLKAATGEWLRQLDAILKTLGDEYGSAISSITLMKPS